MTSRTSKLPNYVQKARALCQKGPEAFNKTMMEILIVIHCDAHYAMNAHLRSCPVNSNILLRM